MKHLLSFFFLITTSGTLIAQASVSATYTASDVPTSYNVYDPICNGPVTTLSITLPGTLRSYEVE